MAVNNGTQRTYTVAQLGFAALVVVVFAVLTYFDKVSGDATIALTSGITGAVLAVPLATRAAQSEARADALAGGLEAQPKPEGNDK